MSRAVFWDQLLVQMDLNSQYEIPFLDNDLSRSFDCAFLAIVAATEFNLSVERKP